MGLWELKKHLVIREFGICINEIQCTLQSKSLILNRVSVRLYVRNKKDVNFLSIMSITKRLLVGFCLSTLQYCLFLLVY